jgi:hypothetical protein
VAVVCALVAVLAVSFHGYSYRPLPAVVAGEPLTPVEIYDHPLVATPGPGQRSVPMLDHRRYSVVIGAQPVATLHVRYARVESMPMAAGWLIHLMAADTGPINAPTNGGFPELLAVIGSQAVEVFSAADFPDRDADCYLLLRSPDQAAALQLARQLTTEVAVVTENRW